MFVFTAMLYFGCVLQTNEFFQKSYKRLKTESQLAISKLFLTLQNNDKITKNILSYAIGQTMCPTSEPAKSSYSPKCFQSPCPQTPENTSKLRKNLTDTLTKVQNLLKARVTELEVSNEELLKLIQNKDEAISVLQNDNTKLCADIKEIREKRTNDISQMAEERKKLELRSQICAEKVKILDERVGKMKEKMATSKEILRKTTNCIKDTNIERKVIEQEVEKLIESEKQLQIDNENLVLENQRLNAYVLEMEDQQKTMEETFQKLSNDLESHLQKLVLHINQFLKENIQEIEMEASNKISIIEEKLKELFVGLTKDFIEEANKEIEDLITAKKLLELKIQESEKSVENLELENNRLNEIIFDMENRNKSKTDLGDDTSENASILQDKEETKLNQQSDNQYLETEKNSFWKHLGQLDGQKGAITSETNLFWKLLGQLKDEKDVTETNKDSIIQKQGLLIKNLGKIIKNNEITIKNQDSIIKQLESRLGNLSFP